MGKKILVYDDDAAILDVAKIVLEEEGYEVVIKMNSENFEAEVKEVRPDLMLVDIWMPGMSGEKLVKKLKQEPKTREIPVVLISANRETAEIAQEAKADGFLCKPFDIEELVVKVRDYL